jgi:hypothetical protein
MAYEYMEKCAGKCNEEEEEDNMKMINCFVSARESLKLATKCSYFE